MSEEAEAAFARAEVTVARLRGIHMRCCSELAALARKYQSRISLRNAKGRASMDSVLSILGLGITNGSSLEISAKGQDAAAAVQAIAEYFTQAVD